jgi:hypothetical protein
MSSLATFNASLTAICLHTNNSKILEPVKLVVTRWNSFYSAFERAAHLYSAYNSYAGYHINAIALADAHATAQGNKQPDAPP